MPNRPLSYTALEEYEECAYRFYMERVLDLGERGRALARIPAPTSTADAEREQGQRSEAAARGAAVHSLLEWSQANEWREPSLGLAGEHAVAAGLDAEADGGDALLDPIRGWLGSALLRERVLAPNTTSRAEAPLLLGVAGATLRGSIDLLVEREAEPPLVLDYKTDRLDRSGPEEHAARYETQRAIYALAVAESLLAPEVEVAYVFLERPDAPVLTALGPAEMETARDRLTATISQIGDGSFPVAAPDERSWSLCRGCPALGRLCSGPRTSEAA